MSRDLNEEYKAIALLPAQTMAATTTGSAVDVEVYLDDAIVIANVPNNAGGANPVYVITVTGSLVATPSTYDQTLATFATTGAGNYGIGATKLNLHGIKNIKGVATTAGSTVCAIAVTALVRTGVKASGTNSTTLA